MTPLESIRTAILASREREKNVTSGPWIIETPMPETLSILHEPRAGCSTADWVFVADVQLPESFEEQQVKPATSRRTAEFIAANRTSEPAFREATAILVEALEKIGEIGHDDTSFLVIADRALESAAALLKP